MPVFFIYVNILALAAEEDVEGTVAAIFGFGGVGFEDDGVEWWFAEPIGGFGFEDAGGGGEGVAVFLSLASDDEDAALSACMGDLEEAGEVCAGVKLVHAVEVDAGVDGNLSLAQAIIGAGVEVGCD